MDSSRDVVCRGDVRVRSSQTGGKPWPSVTLASPYERSPTPGLAGDYVSRCPCPVSSDKVICDFAL